MYRESTHTVCAGCGRSIALDRAELDDEARFVCTRCGARRRFDAALERWHGESRARRPLRALVVVAALGAMVAMPSLAVVALLSSLLAIGVVQSTRRD
jgi:DNA-directed RNA polymerase subunit RPC12/RpoP